jgi:exosortase
MKQLVTGDKQLDTKPAPHAPHSLRDRMLLLSGRSALTVVALAVLISWALWPSLVELFEVWNSDPQYSHGYLVPIFSLVLLWLRRDRCEPAKMQPSGWGVVIIAAGCLMRLAGGYYYYFWLERAALLPIAFGTVLILGGRPALRWSWPALAFLAFMLPLPSGLSGTLAHPLQRIGTLSSSYLLELFGIPAVTEGNVILLRQVDLGVVEACSGLRMLITFFAASAAVVLVSRGPILVRALLFVSAIPIALIVNIVRITVTGVLYETAGPRIAELVFHDLAGWLMIPMALGLLYLVDWFLKRLFLETRAEEHDAIRRSLLVGAPRSARGSVAAAKP